MNCTLTASTVKSPDRTCPVCGVPLDEASPLPLCEACCLSHVENSAGSPRPIPAGAGGEFESSPEEPAEQGTLFGDYRLLAEMGHGGMGIVYKARQLSLGRIVALKRLRVDPDHQELQGRMLREEAMAAAHLSHPNIIPVYEAGEVGGVPYLSMGLVEGASLMHRIATGSIPCDTAARYLMKVARAVDYAHQAGIIHRDLKPANILINAEDEPLVADFGLAARLRGGQVSAPAAGGTPAYMAPEHVYSGGGESGVAGDIYSLGAILYHALTGIPPFQAASTSELLWSTYYDDPLPPSQRNPRVPPDLELLCLKCLAKRPEDRYATAAALALDLERFLRREPVSIRRATLREFVVQWARHHPASAAGIALVFCALASLTAGEWVSRGRAIRARNQAIEARSVAEDLVQFLNTDLGDRLRPVGRLDLLEGVLARIEAYYARYSETTPEFLGRKAAFLLRSAETLQELGKLKEARARSESASALYDRLAGLQPSTPRWVLAHASSEILGSRLDRVAKDLPASERRAHQAVELAQRAAALPPPDPEVRSVQARALMELATTCEPLGKLVEARRYSDEALALLTDLAVANPKRMDYENQLAEAHYHQGLILSRLRDLPRAHAAFSAFLQGMEGLTARMGGDTHWQYNLGAAYANVGRSLSEMGFNPEAMRHFQRAAEVAARLVSRDSSNVQWQHLHGNCQVWLARLSAAAGAPAEEVLPLFRGAVALYRDLLQRNPYWDQWASELDAAESEAAGYQLRQGRLSEAESLWSDAVSNRLALVRFDRSHGPYWQHFARMLTGLGDCVARRQGEREGDAVADFAARWETELRSEFPPAAGPPWPDWAVAELRMLRVRHLAAPPASTASIPHLQEALRLRLRLQKAVPGDPDLRGAALRAYRYLMEYQARAHQLPAAAQTASEAMDWTRSALSVSEGRVEVLAGVASVVTQASGLGTSEPAIARIARECLDGWAHDEAALAPEQRQQAASIRAVLLR